MPELPEVECVRQGIVDALLGQRIVKVWSHGTGNLLDPNSLPLRRMEGCELRAVARRGKYLLWNLGDLQFLAHLGMSGVWQVAGERTKHTHLELTFSTGQCLRYTDPRQFGYMCLTTAAETLPRWEQLGPDAISAQWNAAHLFAHATRSRTPIKVFLLDQHQVAGIGNIYASEALFGAHVHPARIAQSLTQLECQHIVKAAKAVMRMSIRKRGTTFSDYRLTNGKGGSFQGFLKVFQKVGTPCPNCHAPIQQMVQVGRSTFFCAKCQK